MSRYVWAVPVLSIASPRAKQQVRKLSCFQLCLVHVLLIFQWRHAGLDMGGQHFKPGNPAWGKETPEQHDLLQRPASEAPLGGLPMRQLEILPAMKRSASADSVPHITAEDVRPP